MRVSREGKPFFFGLSSPLAFVIDFLFYFGDG
jgi:hypothetical protein